MKVLVTDCGSRKALAAVRSLGRQGYEVIAISNEKINMSRFSKYCSEFYYFPDPLKKPEKFIDELAELLKKNDVDVLIPMEDETVELIIQSIDLFSNVSTLLPDYETFMIARDKGKTMEKAIELGIPCPETYFINNLDEVEEIKDKITYPALVKARISSGSRGLLRVNEKRDLVRRYNEVHKEFDFPIIQQYVEGQFDKVQVLVMFDKHHNVKAVCTYQGIREFPVNGGPVTLWKTISFPEIENKTIEFMKKLNWVGFAEVEYIANPKTGEFYLMEINPRFSANIALAVNVGIDFPVIFTKLATNKEIEFVRNTKFDEYCQWLIPGDLLNFIFNKNRFNQEIGYFFNKPKKIYDAIFSKEDFMPTIGLFLSMFTNLFSSLKNLRMKLKSSKNNT